MSKDFNADPEFVAQAARDQFVEDVLRTLSEQNMTMFDLAQKMGITVEKLRGILNSYRLLTVANMARINCALGNYLYIRSVPSGTVLVEQKLNKIKRGRR
jgi:predicted transcriptional regulator